MERRGLVTVSLTQMPFITEKIGVPRAVAVEFPFGMIWGKPGDAATHRELLGHMLETAAAAREPGTILQLPYTWAEEDVRKRDWFPAEPPPWMADQEKIMQMVEFIRNGDPLA
ncbi:MAG: hypothetical protein ACYC55_02820 [Candidatus Geothermincolia bacterium]